MNENQKRRRTRNTLLGILGIALLLALPFVVTRLYQRLTALPEQVVIATGSRGGLYSTLR